MSKLTLFLMATTTLISACASQPANPTFSDGVTAPANWTGANHEAGEVQAGWLTDLNDPVVTALVEEALTANPEIEQSRARLAQARALLQETRAAQLPFLTAGASTQRTEGGSARTDSQTLGFDLTASWEADLWGRLDSATSATEYQTLARQSDLTSVRQLIAADTARAYFLLIEAGRLSDVERANIESLEETLGFVSKQFERGLRSSEDIALIRTDVQTAYADLDRAEQAQRNAARALEILLGRYPAAALEVAEKLPPRPTPQIFGQPASLLERRPDLQAEKLRIGTEYARTQSARADLLPRLTLTGTFDGSSGNLSDLFDPSALATTLVANATQTLFDRGARKARITGREADIDLAVATYQLLALSAYNEVERELDNGSVLERRETYLTSALSEARDALKFAKFRYELGESDLLNVLSIQQRVASLELQLVQTQRQRLDQYVSLSLALGRSI